MPQSDNIEEYIELNPNRPGPADAWLRDYGVPVWALIGYLEAVHGDLARVAVDYDVPLDAVRAAVAYYRRHQAVIDARRGVTRAWPTFIVTDKAAGNIARGVTGSLVPQSADDCFGFIRNRARPDSRSAMDRLRVGHEP